MPNVKKRNTVYGWNKNGTSPPYVRMEGRLRYRCRDVLKWLDDGGSWH